MLPRICLPIGVTFVDFHAASGREQGDPFPAAAAEGAHVCGICLGFLSDPSEYEDEKYKTTKYELQVDRLSCGHFFHTNCIYPWVARNQPCPSCRTPIAAIDLESLREQRPTTLEHGATEGFDSEITKPEKGPTATLPDLPARSNIESENEKLEEKFEALTAQFESLARSIRKLVDAHQASDTRRAEESKRLVETVQATADAELALARVSDTHRTEEAKRLLETLVAAALAEMKREMQWR
jgi:hypothetical protein